MASLVELRPRHFLQAGGAGSLALFCLSVGVCYLSAGSSFCVDKALGQTTTGEINRRSLDGFLLAVVQTQQKADLLSWLEGR